MRVDPDRDHGPSFLCVVHGREATADIPAVKIGHAAIKSRVAAGTEGTGLNEVRAGSLDRKPLGHPPVPAGSSHRARISPSTSQENTQETVARSILVGRQN